MAPSVSILPTAAEEATNGVAKLNIKEQVKQEQQKQDVSLVDFLPNTID